MTVSTTDNKISYACDGVAVEFSFPYKIFKTTELYVVLTDSDGAETVLVENTGYTVAAISGDYDNGALITTATAYASGNTITVFRQVEMIQETEFPAGGAFPSAAVANAVDRLTMINQQLEEKNVRAVRFPVSDTNPGELPTSGQRANKFLAFDANGDPISAEGMASAPATEFMATVLGDSTAAEARTTLDVPSNSEAQAMADAAESSAEGTAASGDAALQANIDAEKAKTRRRDMELAMRMGVLNGLGVFNMADGVTDMYEDEAGIDAADSINELFVDDDGHVKLLMQDNYSDESPSNHSISAVNMQLGQSGFFGHSYVFNGTSSYLEIPDSPDWDIADNDTDDWTIDLWVNFDTVDQASQILLSQREDASNYWNLYVQDYVLSFEFTSASGVNLSLLGTTAISTGQWYHVTLVKVDDDWAIYLDGVLEINATGKSTSTDTFAAALYIGSQSGGSLYFDGSMDQVRICKKNIFGADPATADDTITVPSAPMVLTNEKYFEPSGGDMTLESAAADADAQPSTGYIAVMVDEQEAVTLNTDLIARVTCDGTTWDTVTLAELVDYGDGRKLYYGDVTLTGTGTTMQYQVSTANSKNVHVKGASLLWD